VVAEGAALVDDQHLAVARRLAPFVAAGVGPEPGTAAALGQQRRAARAQQRQRTPPLGQQFDQGASCSCSGSIGSARRA
jgi:hypothetical protein